MQLRKIEKDIVIEALRHIEITVQADHMLYSKFLRPNSLNIDRKGEEHSIYNYQGSLNLIYDLFIGQDQDWVNEHFAAPAYPGTDKPIGWYRTSFNNDGEYLKGPEGNDGNFSGYIGDRIDELILDHKNGYTLKKRYKLIKRMFKDLVKIDKEFKKGLKND